jgi:hypothetical protein
MAILNFQTIKHLLPLIVNIEGNIAACYCQLRERESVIQTPNLEEHILYHVEDSPGISMRCRVAVTCGTHEWPA